MKKIILLALITAFLCGVILMQPAARLSAQSPVDTRFGAVESFWAPGEAAALGVGWERILFYWSQIQPYGPADWNTLHVADEWLAEANSHGRTVVGLLKNTPDWATDAGYPAGVPRGLYLPIEDPGNLWASFVRQASAYYGPRGVHHWIVWNEPDIAPDVYGHEFAGSVEDYYQLVKVAYQVIKQTDPGATIHLGGMTYWHDQGYLRRYLRVAVADPEAAANNYFFDVVSLHIYFRPETVPMIVGSAFAVQQELGISPLKAVWINETNARPSMDPEWPVQVQAFNIDLEQQAWYLVQAYALGFYAGASRISVYKLVDINMSPGDESWGLIRPYDFSKRPAYFAYQNLIKYLGGFTYPLTRERTNDYFIVGFPRPQGLTRVLWARGASPVSINVPALADSALLVNAITDEKTPVSAANGFYSIQLQGARCHGECLMGGPPVFLVEEGVIVDVIPTAAPPVNVPSQTPVTLSAATATFTPTVTSTPTNTALPTYTAAPTESATAAATAVPTETPRPTATVTEAATAVIHDTATPKPEPAAAPTAAVVDASLPGNGSVAESWWFLGAGGLLGVSLVAAMVIRRRR